VNALGTPNFLRDLSLQCYQASWTEIMQGGLDKAQFDCRISYEDKHDIVAGNLIIFGCYGAQLNANAHLGDGSLHVVGLANVQCPSVKDLIVGDLVLLSDGTNSEMFIVKSIAWGGSDWVVGLNPAWANVQIATQTTLAKDAAQGASQIQVVSGNGLSAGQHIVIGPDAYTIGGGYGGGTTVPISGGLSSSYGTGTPISLAAAGATTIYVDTAQGLPTGSIWLDSGTTNAEGATVNSKPNRDGNVGYPLVLSGAISNAHGGGAPVIFQMNNTLLNAYAVGQAVLVRVLYQGFITQRIHSTARPIQFSIAAQGYFARYQNILSSSTVQEQDAAAMMKRDLASYGSTLPEIIVNDTQAGNWLASSNAIKINLQETDATLMQVIDDILRQENGSSIDVQYAVWVAQDRQVRHLPIATAPPYTSWKVKGHTYSTPTYHLTLSDFDGDTIASLQTTDEDMTALMNAAVVTGTNAPQGSKARNSNSTTLAQNYSPPALSCVVTAVPSTWPSSGSGLYIVINIGTGAGCVATYRGYQGTTVNFGQIGVSHGTEPLGSPVELVTELVNAVGPGKNSFQVQNANIFSSGQQITLTPTGATEESLTINSINYSSGVIVTTTATHKNHGANDIAKLASNGSGTGPRILVEQVDSIKQFGWWEGTLSSIDIYDETRLAQWASRQLSVLAWPKVASQMVLTNTACRISGRDLVQISGFADNSTLVQNVQKVQYTATAADMNISATVDMGILYKTSAQVMQEIAKEHAQRIKYHIPQHHSQQQGMVHGHQINQSDINQVTIDAGTVKVNGQVYQIPSLTTAVPDGESRWGASCGPGVVTPAIVEMPYRLWNNRKVYANLIYTIDQQGDAPQLYSQFSGVPLWKIQSANGVIVGWEPLFTQKGVGLSELPSSSTPAAPVVSGVTQNTVQQSNNIAGDLTVSGTVTNFPTDGACHSLKFYIRTAGTTNWSHKYTLKATGLPQPSTSQPFTVVLHGLPLGESIDVGVSSYSDNLESTITVILSAYVLPQIGSNTATESIVASNTSATRFLISNSSRYSAVIFNKSSAPLYLGTDNTLSLTTFAWFVPPMSSWMLPVPYTGEIWGIWPVANGQANIAAFPA
jgi:hypothetical protein